ncbi:DUF6318 family protein [Cellulomonas sp. P22]|uniref:DUF6318 family protein n=1 Tax=Cellulomonas sp. P22 TaxID=3373189 RepID=UPI003795A8B4
MVFPSRAPDAARTVPVTGSVRRPTAVARVAILAALALTPVTGCTSTPDPSPSPTVTEAVATPTPPPTPTSTHSPKPERPAAMNDPGVDGAIAAATYFVSLFPYVYSTGELAEWNALSHPECEYCSSVRDDVTEMHVAGESQRGPEVAVTSTQGVQIDPWWYSVKLDLKQGPWVIVDSAGATIREDVATTTLHMELAVIPHWDTWLVRAVQVELTDD